ncbi:MAG: GCN5 family acetyltransferase [Planctomycetota bacterium]
MQYPAVLDPDLVGTYDAVAGAGGGFVWDEVLEYRVWMHPELGAEDEFQGDDYFYAFECFEVAAEFADENEGASPPIALILQREHINEVESGVYEHVREERIAEWPVEFLARPKRTSQTIPDFLAADAPANRLEIIRGTVRP